MVARDLMASKGPAVFAVGKDQPIKDVIGLLSGMGIGAVVVSDDNRNLDGILSERDILLALDERGAEVLELRAGDLMTADVVTCNGETLVAKVLATMVDYGVRHLPVVGEDGLEGMISMRDVVQLRLSVLENEVESLRRQLQEGPQAA